MALYDDDDDEPVKPKVIQQPHHVDQKPSPAPSPAPKLAFTFMQSQLLHKRTPQQQSNVLGSAPKPLTGQVMDLSGRARTTPLKPMPARAVVDSALPIFIPKAAIDDSVNMFGEIVIEREYQPAVPNDFYYCKKKKDEQEAREKLAREVATRLEKEHKEEMKKRERGAAFAPPTFLDTPVEKEEEPPQQSQPMDIESFDRKMSTPVTPSFKPFGQSGRGLGVAANIMSKMGYREGAGLGKSEQGISTALVVDRVGKSGKMGQISGPEAAPPAPMSQQDISDAMKSATKVVLLKNMITCDEIDEELEPEIKEEMDKYGQVVNVAIHKMTNPVEGDEVRIFVEYTNVAQAIKAFIVQSGRFFAGRPVQAAFYKVDDYNDKNWEL